MTKRILRGSLIFFALVILSQCRTIVQPDEYYCNIMAGEPTQTSVILFARLHKTDTLVNNDLMGIDGFIKFRITRDINAKSYIESMYFRVQEENDYSAQYKFSGLRPGQIYFYSISYGSDSINNTSSSWNSFSTLNIPGSPRNVNFAVINDIDYNSFMKGNSSLEIPPATGYELRTGIPGFHDLAYFKPDFIISNGDKILAPDDRQNDETGIPAAATQIHKFFSMKEFNRIHSFIPDFWLLSNDSPPGLLPIPESSREILSFCRTYRVNRDVQIWLIGNTGHISDQPEQNLFREDQLKWLKTSLKSSDSPFKLIISPVSLLDPVILENPDLNESLKPLIMQKDSLFSWLRNNGYRNNGLYFINCKSHYQYHSIDPSGFEEFSCGSIVGALFQKSAPENDSISPEKTAKIVQPYSQEEAFGGFMMVNSDRDEFNSPLLLFRFYNDQRKITYAVNRF